MLIYFLAADAGSGLTVISAKIYQAVFHHQRYCLSFLFLMMEANHIKVHVKNEGTKISKQYRNNMAMKGREVKKRC